MYREQLTRLLLMYRSRFRDFPLTKELTSVRAERTQVYKAVRQPNWTWLIGITSSCTNVPHAQPSMEESPLRDVSDRARAHLESSAVPFSGTSLGWCKGPSFTDVKLGLDQCHNMGRLLLETFSPTPRPRTQHSEQQGTLPSPRPRQLSAEPIPYRSIS